MRWENRIFYPLRGKGTQPEKVKKKENQTVIDLSIAESLCRAVQTDRNRGQRTRADSKVTNAQADLFQYSWERSLVFMGGRLRRFWKIV
jgi:hypothetical protein